MIVIENSTACVMLYIEDDNCPDIPICHRVTTTPKAIKAI